MSKKILVYYTSTVANINPTNENSKAMRSKSLHFKKRYLYFFAFV